jgi:hypothetical protein
MSTHSLSDAEILRAEIAAAAARMIAEDGVDYGTAKRKAAKQILGNRKVRGDVLPDNTMLEDEVRLYNELFFADTQPARLLHLRQLAVRIMTELAPFQPHLTGAVLNGTAGQHSDIYLQLFADSPKDVEIYLMDKRVDFEVSESSHFKGRNEPVETLSFIWQQEGVHLALYESDDLRGAIRKSASGRQERADIEFVRALILESEQK